MKLALGLGVLLVALCAPVIVSYLSVQDLRDLSAVSEQKASARSLAQTVTNMDQIAQLARQSADGARDSAQACQALSGSALDC